MGVSSIGSEKLFGEGLRVIACTRRKKLDFLYYKKSKRGNPTHIPVKTTIVDLDPYLKPYYGAVQDRIRMFEKTSSDLFSEDSLYDFASAHNYFGVFHDKENDTFIYREYAPAAKGLFLIGDFNNWNRTSHPLEKRDDGIWEIFLPGKKYRESFIHRSRLKVHVITKDNSMDRIPVYTRKTQQDPETWDICAQIWIPDNDFKWSDNNFQAFENKPIIYEAHTGMAQEKEGVGSYREFSDKILPRIKEAGYNTIQLMGIMEHPYYASFGYQVSNFFAPASRFGNPEDLKQLINEAHNAGIAVIMDLIHSHSIRNINEGINLFDGTTELFFHAGSKGDHSLWDSKLFNYGSNYVLRFLLSNIRYWLEEFHFDGFRFDGVTSMIYYHHGHYKDFTHYDMYFNGGIDNEAVLYLQLANKLIHEIKPRAITIAEEVSGIPGLCRPIEEGGIGFDFRSGMGIPDFWIKTIKEKADEDWNMDEIYNQLTNRRPGEKTIAYCESHDQALVGDKTIAFRLMDKEMYWHMRKDDNNHIIDRGIALHKLIRLLTISLGGEGYLNFMGNEFGHPEWIDFPREGNNYSYKYACRQWSLRDSPLLKYSYLAAFDRGMIDLVKKYNLLSNNGRLISIDQKNKIICFEKAGLVFVFSFNATHSLPGYKIGVPLPGTYKIIFSSDAREYGGFERIKTDMEYNSRPLSLHGFSQGIVLYITNRTGIVLECIKQSE